ncbi:MAG: alpha/beta fold hydrolase, partial [Bacteroidales bacterium]|nr:alpha/beta fold hydrolase [Bacteroidales bacterium]
MNKLEKKIFYKEKPVTYVTEGKGNAVVLLHGFLESRSMWDHFSTVLSDDFLVISIDLPGHGQTATFSETPTMDFMAGIVKTVLDHEDIKKCVMIGHSMGGYVTAEFANLFPHYLSGIGFFHSQVAGDNEEARKNRDRTIKLIEKYRVSFIKSFIPDLFAPGNVEVFKNEIEQLKNEAATMKVEAIVAA